MKGAAPFARGRGRPARWQQARTSQARQNGRPECAAKSTRDSPMSRSLRPGCPCSSTRTRSRGAMAGAMPALRAAIAARAGARFRANQGQRCAQGRAWQSPPGHRQTFLSPRSAAALLRSRPARRRLQCRPFFAVPPADASLAVVQICSPVLFDDGRVLERASSRDTFVRESGRGDVTDEPRHAVR